jgi:probable rRNA maturation factor
MARTGVAVEIRVEAPGWRKAWPGVSREARQVLLSMSRDARLGPVPKGVVAIVFSDDARVRLLNSRFRGKDGATNVLSFPDRAAPLGGMALALETLEKEAKEQGKPFVNHVKHMILHGFLHLLGHDHHTKTERRLMERLEIDILAGMGIPNPYVIEAKTRA